MRISRHYGQRPSRYTVGITCQVVRQRDFRLVADRIENLSTWGMLVSPADPVLTGEKVYVSFKVPGTDTWIDASATITRVIHGRRPGEISRKLGLEFEDLSEFDRFQLRQALVGRPYAPPGPRAGRREANFDLAGVAA